MWSRLKSEARQIDQRSTFVKAFLRGLSLCTSVQVT